jgi:RNA polymerase sigma-70 factor (ECF subfamily)
MDSTSPSLLERLRRQPSGDDWSRFVRLYTPLLFGWARRIGVSENDAADLVQNVFATLLEQLPTFQYDPHGSFRAWLHAVLRNRWRVWVRKRQPTPGGDLDALPDTREPSLPDEADDRMLLVRRALALLETDFQPVTWEAFRRTLLLGQPIPVVAAELGLSPNAVYIARSRVLKRLRQEVAGL